MILLLLLHAIHYSHGPYGITAWIQPPFASAGLEFIHGHINAWFELQPTAPNMEHIYFWHVR